jgi:hypothetical protein
MELINPILYRKVQDLEVENRSFTYVDSAPLKLAS